MNKHRESLWEEGDKAENETEFPGISETCRHIVSIFRLKSVQTLAFILLTFKIAFAPGDAVANFKLQVRSSIQSFLLRIIVFQL